MIKDFSSYKVHKILNLPDFHRLCCVTNFFRSILLSKYLNNSEISAQDWEFTA